MDWFPWYPADYKRDTYRLTLAEDGAYRRLIDEYMVNRGPLPDDDAALARIIGVTSETWLAIAPAVRTFFHSNPQGELTHKRCDQELRRQAVVFERNSARGQKAAYKRWSKNNAQHARRMLAVNTLTLRDIDSSLQSPTEEPHTNGHAAPVSGAPIAAAANLSASSEMERIAKRKGWTP